MKKFTLSLVAVLALAVSASAQYYYRPYTFFERHTDHPGKNPGQLNTDAEYPVGSGLPAGWTTIDNGAAASPRWTASQTLPFAFNFNGSPETAYKVSTSGVLTFDVATAVAAPSYTNVAIPSASIPDRSVMVWGIAGTGSNDKIVTKVFGTAPNRQLWIFFSSYSIPGVSTSCYTYFSIVLEETSNRIFVVDQRNPDATSCNPTLTIGVQVDATTATAVAGSPNVDDLATSSPGQSDNRYYEFINGVQPVNDAYLYSLSINQFNVPPASPTLTAKYINFGSAPITALDLKYDLGGTTYTDSRSGLSINFASTGTIVHTAPVSVAAPGRYAIHSWVDMTGDVDHTNDSGNIATHGLSNVPAKTVLFEEATGTWCGWCPRGTVFMDSMRTVHPTTATLIAVHNSDPMTVSNYDAGMGEEVGGYPSGLVDRKTLDVDPSSFFTWYNTRSQDKVPCSVDVQVSYDQLSRFLTATVSATFTTTLEGDYRFNAVLVEDNCSGTTSTWAQTNYYSSTSQNIALVGAGHNWQAEPNPVPASQMVYDHVGRYLFGGWDGAAGSLPAVIPDGSTQTHTFTYSVPASVNPLNTHVIGWVCDPVSGNVFNSARSAGTLTGISAPAAASFDVTVFPNPATDGMFNVRVNLKKGADVHLDIFDYTGRQVLSTTEKKLAQGDFIYPVDLSKLSKGMYSIRITAGDEQVTRKAVVQ
jgi:hypothetical protein